MKKASVCLSITPRRGGWWIVAFLAFAVVDSILRILTREDIRLVPLLSLVLICFMTCVTNCYAFSIYIQFSRSGSSQSVYRSIGSKTVPE